MIPLLGNLIVRFYKKKDNMRLLANRDTFNSTGQIQIPGIQSQRSSSSDNPSPRDVELTNGIEHYNNEPSLDDDKTISHSEDAAIEEKNNKLDIEKDVAV